MLWLLFLFIILGLQNLDNGEDVDPFSISELKGFKIITTLNLVF